MQSQENRIFKAFKQIVQESTDNGGTENGKGVRLFQGETQSAMLQTHISKAIQMPIGNI